MVSTKSGVFAVDPSVSLSSRWVGLLGCGLSHAKCCSVLRFYFDQWVISDALETKLDLNYLS